MKKAKLIVVVVVAIAAIVGILLKNKSEMEAKANIAGAKLSEIPVSVTAVKKGLVKQSLSMVGTIVAENDVAIISETQGKVTHVLSEIGDWRQAGAVLVQVDDELKLAEFKVRKVDYEKAQKDYERYQELFKQGAISESQLESTRLTFEAAEANFIVARRQYEDTKIKTPVTGVISARDVDLGDMVQPGMVVANVVNISRLKVNVNVPETDVFKLKVGDSVAVATDVYPNVIFDGKIKSISDKADQVHNYPVEITLKNSKQHPLKSGMFGHVTFLSIQDKEGLMLPRSVLVGSIKEPQVYVVENGVATLTKIEVGSTTGTSLEISNGLKEGDTVVLSGQQNLRNGIPVKIVSQMP
ncbi:efflux transporter, RND family, MFP subunit [Chloroherpeton thalassium ATCC 35110]|uniref:Efflux transporter, RND family, MFP subunit n=1 Tax=Chloroherpeton thalassium (strain ATCC 35110 / GB-78) TaxID=517418 RepID=B3QYY1_CHLT3|nr:efflux RND transporter periplasmic adaptor subunit [Chloroherpeton thalassium]ACF13674.1 efflux transporter, RND family, MFP subunit [Chloroherpeton thalassium ATCC 35110]